MVNDPNRVLTRGERELLIANSDLVMFDANRGFKAHWTALFLAFVPFVIVTAFDVAAMIIFDEQISDHPGLCMCPICATFFIAAGLIPLLYIFFDDLAFKRAGRSSTFLHSGALNSREKVENEIQDINVKKDPTITDRESFWLGLYNQLDMQPLKRQRLSYSYCIVNPHPHGLSHRKWKKIMPTL